MFLYLDSGNTIRRMRSVLFQAKMTAHTGAYVIEDKEQRELYGLCDGFDYVHGKLKGESRQFPKKAARKRALQYAFVGPRPPEICTIPSDKGKGTSVEYGEHLVWFLNGKTGINVAKKKQGWSQVVLELMENGAEVLATDGKDSWAWNL